MLYIYSNRRSSWRLRALWKESGSESSSRCEPSAEVAIEQDQEVKRILERAAHARQADLEAWETALPVAVLSAGARALGGVISTRRQLYPDGSDEAGSRWLRWVGAAGRRALPPRGLDLLLDERDSKDPLCAQEIVLTAEKTEKSLVVAAMQSKRELVLNLQSGSRATPGPVRSVEFALLASPLVHALANL